MTEQVYARGFLSWSYNTRLGQRITGLLFRKQSFSKVYGWIHKQRWSRWKIKSFVQKADVNLDELVSPLEDFASFNDFFIRKIDLTKRRIDSNPNVCSASADGKVLVYPEVKLNTTFRIKRSTFNLRKFLNSDSLAEKFERGSMVVSRLCLADYHHFHFPDSGIPHRTISIPGNYHAGGPYSLRNLIPFYTENHRTLTLFDSDHFGQTIMAEIGALTVGSIQQDFQPDVHVEKGHRKGYFELGGSTVVLLFQKGRIELDEDLCMNTKKGIETYVRLGDSIGRNPKVPLRRKNKNGGDGL